MNPKVGDRIVISANLIGANGPVSIGAYPLRFSCPTGHVMPDPKTNPNGDSYDQRCTFICMKAGQGVNVGYTKYPGNTTLHTYIQIDIDDLPTITAQGAQFEGIVP